MNAIIKEQYASALSFVANCLKRIFDLFQIGKGKYMMIFETRVDLNCGIKPPRRSTKATLLKLTDVCQTV